MASQPSLRIGDRERDAVAAELREHFAHGRLTQEEFTQRLDAVFAAKTQSDLNWVLRDLPHVRPAGAPWPSGRSNNTYRMTSAQGAWSSRGAIAADGPNSVWSAADWAGAGSDQGSAGDWSGRRRSPHGIRAFATLIAALAAWLLVYDVILVAFKFPLPGRLGLLVSIFAIIRGLLRRIFGARRR